MPHFRLKKNKIALFHVEQKVSSFSIWDRMTKNGLTDVKCQCRFRVMKFSDINNESSSASSGTMAMVSHERMKPKAARRVECVAKGCYRLIEEKDWKSRFRHATEHIEQLESQLERLVMLRPIGL